MQPQQQQQQQQNVHQQQPDAAVEEENGNGLAVPVSMADLEESTNRVKQAQDGRQGKLFRPATVNQLRLLLDLGDNERNGAQQLGKVGSIPCANEMLPADAMTFVLPRNPPLWMLPQQFWLYQMKIGCTEHYGNAALVRDLHEKLGEHQDVTQIPPTKGSYLDDNWTRDRKDLPGFQNRIVLTQPEKTFPQATCMTSVFVPRQQPQQQQPQQPVIANVEEQGERF